MARKIIVLAQTAIPSGGTTTDLDYSVAFWLVPPVSRQPFYANAAATSQVIGALAAEVTAIQAGQVVEQIVPVSYSSGTAIAAITADLAARYNAAQALLTANNPWNRYGTSWDGTTWTQVTVT